MTHPTIGGRFRVALAFLDGADPAIPASRHRLEVFRLARLVAEHAAQLGDHPRERVIGDRGIRPDGFEDLLFTEEVTRTLDHQEEEVERFRLK